MNMEVVRGQEAGGSPRLVTQQEAPETPIAIDVEEFSDVELIEHAEAGLGDALDVMTQVEDVLDSSNGDAATLQLELAKLSLRVQPVERHAMTSAAASSILNNRRLERLTLVVEQGHRETTAATVRVASALERIAAVFERSEQVFTAELGGSSGEVQS